MNKEDLIKFEEEIAELFNTGKIRAPVHLYHGNEDQIIDIFNGKLNEFSEAVCLNSAAALVIAGKYNEVEEAFKFSKNHISSGNTINHLKQMQIS